MLAPRDQLTRWQRLLTQPAATPPPDGRALADALDASHGKHRQWIVACLAAIDAVRQGVQIRWNTPLPAAPTSQRPAADGAAAANDVWTAYLLWTLDIVSPTNDGAAHGWLRQLIRQLHPTALVFTANDNPEPWWQNEMVILHALHSFALRSGEADLLIQTLACADFHLREIQPDHATNEPWSVHAYASHADGNVTAETLLHAGYIQHGGELGPIARLLCRDAATSLAAYLEA